MAWLMMRVSIAMLLTKFHLDLDPTVNCTAYWDRTEGQMKHRLKARFTPIVSKLGKGGASLISQADPRNQNLAIIKELSTQTETVPLPDLFVSWASVPLKLNPNYPTVSKAADQWFKE
jgi:hypothetical protein